MLKKSARLVSLEPLENRTLFAAVTASLTLYDSSGNPLAPASPGVWNIVQGTTFEVGLEATVTSPNLTNAARTDSTLRNLPLGVENLAADIITGTANVVAPLADTSTSPQQWSGYTDLTPDSFAYPFTNLIDRNSDGELDVANAGMDNITFSISSLQQMPKFQYGAGTSGATVAPMPIVMGSYQAMSAGTTLLTTKINQANVYADTNSDAAVTAVDVTSTAVNTSITINVTPAPASVSGRVFDDKNANGIFDGSDTGISGFRVFLDTNNNGILDAGEVSKPVSATGTYTFSGVTPGTYRVREVFRDGWRQSFPALGYYQVTLRSGDVAKSLSFANTDTVLIKGTVFMDANKDGALTSGEPGLAGWQLYLDANNNGILDAGETSVLSDANGNYRFFNIPAGHYVVRIVQQAKYTQTSPGGKAYSMTLAAAGTTSNKNFGEKRLK